MKTVFTTGLLAMTLTMSVSAFANDNEEYSRRYSPGVAIAHHLQYALEETATQALTDYLCKRDPIDASCLFNNALNVFKKGLSRDAVDSLMKCFLPDVEKVANIPEGEGTVARDVGNMITDVISRLPAGCEVNNALNTYTPHGHKSFPEYVIHEFFGLKVRNGSTLHGIADSLIRHTLPKMPFLNTLHVHTIQTSWTMANGLWSIVGDSLTEIADSWFQKNCLMLNLCN